MNTLSFNAAPKAQNPKQVLASLPPRPGIYQMLDDKGNVLYIGKAKHLRKRVSSYFRKTGLSPKTAALVEKICDIQVTVTETEVEALLLEQNLIKQHRPPFNILLRDDKSYPYIFLSSGEPFPRLAFHRGSKRKKGFYFGPYPSSQAVRDSMRFLQKTFRVRQCEDSFYRNRSRPCLQYQIKRCTGPCVGLVSAPDYNEDVRHTRMFLEGKNEPLVRELQNAMDQASAKLNFEEAAQFRDQIAALRQIQAQQVIETGTGNIDVLAAAIAESSACIHALYIRQGRILGSRSFYLKVPLASDTAQVLADFIPPAYLKGGAAPDLPGEIIAPVAAADAPLLSQALSKVFGKHMQVKRQVRGTRTRWLALARRTAEQNLSGRLASRQSLLHRLEALQKALGLGDTPTRLECFDISHSSGEATQASCVVFGAEGPIKSDYRRFNITGVTAGDDYAAMEQALRKRYASLQKKDGKLPDILLIDGGKGQLRRAVAVLNDLNILGVTLLGVAKGSTRKPGMETLFLATESGEKELRPTPSALHLIQQVRDEAHRFAITGHRQRRSKARTTSPLESIEGVGPKRRRELLRFFGGIDRVQKASVADLMRVPGIHRKVAEAIYSGLHSR